MAYETLHEVMFDRHRIRRWRIGHEAQLAGFTRADVHGYYASRYVPERTIVSIVGAVDPERALALAREAYGDWPAAPGAVDPSPEEPARHEVRARTLRGDVTQADLSLGWRAAPPLAPDAPALDLAAAVLGAGRGSWLYRGLREPGLVTWVGAHYYAPTELGLFGVAAELSPARVPAALDAIAAAVARLALLGPPPDDLERARTLLRARWARRLESMEGRASALAAAEALDGYASSTASSRRSPPCGRTTCAPPRRATCSPTPSPAVALSPRGRGRRTHRRRARPRLRRHRAPPATRPRRALSAAAAAVRHRPPATRREADVRPHQPSGRRPAGAPEARRAAGAPRHLRAAAGASTRRRRPDSARSPCGAPCAARATSTRPRWPSRSSGWAARWARSPPPTGSDSAPRVLAEHLAEAAALLDLVHTSPRLEERDVERERGLMVAEAQQVADDMFRYPFQLAFAAAFGEEGYGLPVAGLPAHPAGHHRGRRAGVARARAARRPSGGDRRGRRGARRGLGAPGGRVRRGAEPRRRSARCPRSIGWPEPAARRPRASCPGDKAQAAIAMAFPGRGAASSATGAAAQVWAAVASGLGGRLFEALRDRRSLAYTVVASAWLKARAGALVTYIATSPEREEEAREEMLRELERFTREPVSESELRQAVNYLAGQAEVSRQSGSAVAGEILEAWVAGSGLERARGSRRRPIRAVTAEDVLRVAQASLDPERRVEGVVRGTGASRPPVAAPSVLPRLSPSPRLWRARG